MRYPMRSSFSLSWARQVHRREFVHHTALETTCCSMLPEDNIACRGTEHTQRHPLWQRSWYPEDFLDLIHSCQNTLQHTVHKYPGSIGKNRGRYTEGNWRCLEVKATNFSFRHRNPCSPLAEAVSQLCCFTSTRYNKNIIIYIMDTSSHYFQPVHRLAHKTTRRKLQQLQPFPPWPFS